METNFAMRCWDYFKSLQLGFVTWPDRFNNIYNGILAIVYHIFPSEDKSLKFHKVLESLLL